ncbi:MAG: hypothetical protein ACI8Y4_002112 [Candidatus Poriferisodalaceae bacterium]|jgi:hypothetical protein
MLANDRWPAGCNPATKSQFPAVGGWIGAAQSNIVTQSRVPAVPASGNAGRSEGGQTPTTPAECPTHRAGTCSWRDWCDWCDVHLRRAGTPPRRGHPVHVGPPLAAVASPLLPRRCCLAADH